MCGRFALISSPETLADVFGLEGLPDLFRRYNIAPSQSIPIIRQTPEGKRDWAFARWGLIPSWSKEPKAEFSTINARAETVAIKPTFRSAFRRRRCLIPATHYFEWRQRPGSKLKQAYCIQLKGGHPFAFAGLWEHWRQGETIVESCSIIVTDANALTQPIHDRMPVILRPADYTTWLDRQMQTPAPLLDLARPFDSEVMEAYPVSPKVNNPRNDTPDILEPIVLAEGVA